MIIIIIIIIIVMIIKTVITVIMIMIKILWIITFENSNNHNNNNNEVGSGKGLLVFDIITVFTQEFRATLPQHTVCNNNIIWYNIIQENSMQHDNI